MCVAALRVLNRADFFTLSRGRLVTDLEQPPRIAPKGDPAGELTLRFEDGTLIVDGLDDGAIDSPRLLFDDRIRRYRAPAFEYRAVLGELVRARYAVTDEARGYAELPLEISTRYTPYEHQQGAIDAWVDAGKRGVVILPTGAGKTYVAQLAIEEVGRSALVLVPTIDLLNQWSGILQRAFDQEIGLLGGGYHELRDITVSTYDSAAIHMDRVGAKFGLIIFDEVHHLPGEMYRQAAASCIAPFRLGLTATFERADGKESLLTDVVGPVAFRRSIKDLAGDILADYEVRTLEIEMTEDDFVTYTEARELYRSFCKVNSIRMGSVNGWKRFLAETSRSQEGRRAFEAYQSQKRLALVHQAKLDRLYELLEEHHDDRVIIFTNDNASVYEISRRMLCPAITHQTPIKERKEILARFNEGTYKTVATSKVLNEGVDVPEARVAMILSGSGSVREHVQRLGRILRRAADKKALLYELVTQNSVETYVSQRRREHDAYQ